MILFQYFKAREDAALLSPTAEQQDLLSGRQVTYENTYNGDFLQSQQRVIVFLIFAFGDVLTKENYVMQICKFRSSLSRKQLWKLNE